MVSIAFHALVEEKASVFGSRTAIAVPLAARVSDLGSWLTASTAAAASTRCPKVRAAARLISCPVNAEVLFTESAEESLIGEFKSRAGGHLVPDGTVEVDEAIWRWSHSFGKLVKFVEVFAEFLPAMGNAQHTARS